MEKISFIYTTYTTFVKTDFEILNEEFKVEKYHFKPRKGLLGFWQIIKQLFFLITLGWKYDIFYIWFADYHSFLPVLFAKLFNKKSFVVIGGYDVCRIPSIHYGVFYNKLRGYFAINTMRYCTNNLTVSSYVDRIVKAIAPKTNRTLIYNGVRLKNDLNQRFQKEQIILTVGIIDDERTFLRKGIDTFIAVAKLFPSYQFICIGINKQKLKSLIQDIPENLKVYERVEQKKLIDYYKKAKIYAQFSRMDTFCLALAEAMLFDCIPVINNIGGMPEVMGESGYLVKRDLLEITTVIKDIINNKNKIKEVGAKRIVSKFSFNTRKIKLLDIIHSDNI